MKHFLHSFAWLILAVAQFVIFEKTNNWWFYAAVQGCGILSIYHFVRFARTL